MCSEVRVDGGIERDPRRPVAVDAEIELVARRFVSRGGDKLYAALEAWRIAVADRVWLDAGASTGGFTDCLLQSGAATVHAVDVGYNQLAYDLRRDRRVVVHERTNILDLDSLRPRPASAVCDLSFRSLRGVLRHILELTVEGWGIALLKPQFELAAEARWNREGTHDALAGGGGVVLGDSRGAVIGRVIEELSEIDGIRVLRSLDSPVRGRHGNREVLLLVGLVDQLRKSEGRNGSPM
ncbi:MAG: hypothetical protein MI724_02125 [Spirochaetales bacterium]|nr:hypothetical protein [Spirochaetales bacterium]